MSILNPLFSAYVCLSAGGCTGHKEDQKALWKSGIFAYKVYTCIQYQAICFNFDWTHLKVKFLPFRWSTKLGGGLQSRGVVRGSKGAPRPFPTPLDFNQEKDEEEKRGRGYNLVQMIIIKRKKSNKISKNLGSKAGRGVVILPLLLLLWMWNVPSSPPPHTPLSDIIAGYALDTSIHNH